MGVAIIAEGEFASVDISTFYPGYSEFAETPSHKRPLGTGRILWHPSLVLRISSGFENSSDETAIQKVLGTNLMFSGG